jgi:DNA-directed RNA polymerase subunit RPC12/RpoP
MSRPAIHIRETHESYVCASCGRTVDPAESGTRNRNHCPYCLHSRHVDLRPGDRRSGCHGDMEPIGIWVRPGGEWNILHRCTRCGFIRSNRVAGDDNEALLLVIAARPLGRIPFPVESLIRTQG